VGHEPLRLIIGPRASSVPAPKRAFRSFHRRSHMSKAAQYRFIGANCAQLAEKESHQHRKQQILHIAGGWLTLAENEEWLSASIPPFANERASSPSTTPARHLTIKSPVADVHRWEPVTTVRQEWPRLSQGIAPKSCSKCGGRVYCVETTPYPDRPNRGLQILVCARCGYTQLVERPAREVPGLNGVAATLDRQV
jgi:hypothetical protein